METASWARTSLGNNISKARGKNFIRMGSADVPRNET
jgi:hypothetical protein